MKNDIFSIIFTKITLICCLIDVNQIHILEKHFSALYTSAKRLCFSISIPQDFSRLINEVQRVLNPCTALPVALVYLCTNDRFTYNAHR